MKEISLVDYNEDDKESYFSRLKFESLEFQCVCI